MGENYSVYISDDEEELIEFIEDMSDNVFDGTTETFKKAVELMQKDYEDTLRELSTGDEDDDVVLT